MSIVVIVNPTKVDDLDQVRATLSGCAAERGHGAPRLVETTTEDPGFGQTRDAVASGATLVCPLGGDGTVRAVAQELVGTGVPLGLLPGGTGNLLARNVGAPVSDLGEAFATALDGIDRVVDVGWLVLDPDASQRQGVPAPAANVHCFTVMAGLGFDAQIMDDAPEGVKDRVGWAAYVASGGQHLLDDGFGLEVVADGETTSYDQARTVVVGNCGELTGGMVLLPEAVIDDGILDLAVLTPAGITDWLGVAARVLTQRDTDGPSLERLRGGDVVLRASSPQPAEVDGDVLTPAAELRLVVQPSCLTVRVPSSR
jgi:diacylglycerol kinase (ATP)